MTRLHGRALCILGILLCASLVLGGSFWLGGKSSVFAAVLLLALGAAGLVWLVWSSRFLGMGTNRATDLTAAVGAILISGIGAHFGRLDFEQRLRAEIPMLEAELSRRRSPDTWDVASSRVFQRAILQTDEHGERITRFPLEDGSVVEYVESPQARQRRAGAPCAKELAPGWYSCGR
jgi:hypothetical protein